MPPVEMSRGKQSVFVFASREEDQAKTVVVMCVCVSHKDKMLAHDNNFKAGVPTS